MEVITPEEFARLMKELDREGKYDYSNEYIDPEALHIRMDDLLMETLRSLGYDEGVEIFDKAPKRYS